MVPDRSRRRRRMRQRRLPPGTTLRAAGWVFSPPRVYPRTLNFILAPRGSPGTAPSLPNRLARLAKVLFNFSPPNSASSWISKVIRWIYFPPKLLQARPALISFLLHSCHHDHQYLIENTTFPINESMNPRREAGSAGSRFSPQGTSHCRGRFPAAPARCLRARGCPVPPDSSQVSAPLEPRGEVSVGRSWGSAATLSLIIAMGPCATPGKGPVFLPFSIREGICNLILACIFGVHFLLF